MTTLPCLTFGRTMHLDLYLTSKMHVFLLGVGCLSAWLVLLQMHVQLRQDLHGRFDLLATEELECRFEVHELFAEGGVAPVRMRLEDFYGRTCMLPYSDFGDQALVSGELNQALCALLVHIGAQDSFQALGKTCRR